MSKSKAQHYSLNISEFPIVCEDFVKDLGEGYSHTYNYNINSNPKTITITITKNGISSILICYIKEGQVSFNPQGKNAEIAEQCRDKLINDTKINAIDKKVFTVKKVSEDDFLAVIKYLSENFKITDEKPSEHEKYSFSFKDELDAHIIVHYYITGTLMVQGKVTSLLMETVSACSELLSPDTIKESQIAFFELTGEKAHAVEESLKNYIPDGYDKIEGKIENVMYPSLVLLNNPFELPDYSCCAFPVLRGIEGVLKKKISEEVGSFTNFGDFFQKDGDGWILKASCSIFSNDEVKHAALNLYNFYNKNRHTTFHMDLTTETSRVLDYGTACDVVKEGLGLISRLCKCW